jgi:1,4-dihydroxy-2-naphthoyl-CoA hydrolase
MHDASFFNTLGQRHLPAHLGIRISEAGQGLVQAELEVQISLMAPNGFLHAGALVTLADTCAGYGCLIHLPEGATGFTTIELKSNHLATAREGTVVCEARPAHLGKSTQVWDAIVRHRQTDRTLIIFRCTQMILYPNRNVAGGPT